MSQKGTGMIADRFWAKVRKGDGCWEWQGQLRPNGYGRFRMGSHSNDPKVPAHRVAWELTNGPIPTGLCVCHRCDNPPCVNPDHLFLGTRVDNNLDRDVKGRASKGEAHPMAKLTRRAVDAIRATYVSSSRTHGGHALAREYGVGQMTILRVVRGETWNGPRCGRRALG